MPNNNSTIKYINKDFGDLRSMMIELAKSYYPKTYSDFNESSVGMMFIEMIASVGDVMSFYSDIQLQESFLYTASEKINIYNLAKGFGYKPQFNRPAQVDLEVMHVVPSVGSGNNTEPDFDYALNIKSGMIVSTDDNITFRTVQDCNFKHSGSMSPTEVSVFSTTQAGDVEYYLLKKSVKAVSGNVRTRQFEFTESKKYDKITLGDQNVVEIIDIYDSDGEKWYEVDFLAQDLVMNEVRNMPYNDPELSQYNSEAPYLLTYKKAEKRFVTRIREDDLMEIQFGAGLGDEQDEEIIPSPYNVAIGLDYFKRVDDVAIDPVNFLYTKTYGKAPENTTLTVRYSVSSGIEENVKSNTLENIVEFEADDLYGDITPATEEAVLESIAVTNPSPAYGASNTRDLENIRQDAMAYFAAQNRAVNTTDIIMRCYSMPAKYGGIAKAYVQKDMQNSQWGSFERMPNPYSLNLYVLAYDSNKNFVPANAAIKFNLKNYLETYKMSTDAYNIRDPYIINVGIRYDIITRPNTDSYEVLARCTQRLRELFSPEKMEINKPILLNKLYTELDKVEGVQTVVDITIRNLNDQTLGYSKYSYDIKTATKNGIIYPSVDPCVFEVKNLNRDILGSVVDY